VGRDGFLRNVCVALGNRAEPAAVPPLARALATDPSPLVRAHAAWALGVIAARRPEAREGAQRALRDATADADSAVRGEAVMALAEGTPPDRPQ
jgi:epoxyqueuosine reductase